MIRTTFTTLLYFCSSWLSAAEPTPFEQAEKNRFVDASFPEVQRDGDAGNVGLAVLEGGKNWWDRVQLDSAWGTEFRIGKKIYRRGLFCHAPRKLEVRLPAPAICINIDVREEAYNFEALKKAIALWRVVAPNYLGDFYPLTPYSLAEDTWMAWQFNRPEVGKGLIQAFQRDESIFPRVQLRMRGLKRNALYEVKNHDVAAPFTRRGSELMDRGLLVTVDLDDRPAAVVITYQKKMKVRPMKLRPSAFSIVFVTPGYSLLTRQSLVAQDLEIKITEAPGAVLVVNKQLHKRNRFAT